MTTPYVMAVVHARGGSVRVPGKNLRPLAGKPLVQWGIAAAVASRCDRVILSTDSPAIAEAGRAAGAETPFMRPAVLAEEVPSEWVTRHALDFIEAERGAPVDVVVTIQPTTPFVRARDIDACLDLLLAHPELDSALTMGPVHQRPEWMYVPTGHGAARKLQPEPVKGDAGITQALPKLLHPNGGAYATRRHLLIEDGVLIGLSVGAVEMDRLRSTDIDEEIDFMTAEAVAAHLGLGRA